MSNSSIGSFLLQSEGKMEQFRGTTIVSVRRDNKVAIGNIYDATENYGSETRASYDDSVFRARYLAWVFENNPQVEFKFYFPDGYEIIQVDLPNVTYHDYVML